MICRNCDGEHWVCENHPDKAWAENLSRPHAIDRICGCGAGMPCKSCNEPITRWGFDRRKIICSVLDQ